MTSPAMECYVGRSSPTGHDVVYISHDKLFTQNSPYTVGQGYRYMPSRTASGEHTVCASYSVQAWSSSEWVWYYEVMPASLCIKVEAAAAAGTNVTAGYVASMTCCTAPYFNKPGEHDFAEGVCYICNVCVRAPEAQNSTV